MIDLPILREYPLFRLSRCEVCGAVLFGLRTLAYRTVTPSSRSVLTCNAHYCRDRARRVA